MIVRTLLITAALSLSGLFPSGYRGENLDLRGKTQTLAIYDPAPGKQQPLAVVVTSGDVGWIGIGVDVAEHLQKEGYRVIGFNARAYLSSFTGNGGLNAQDTPGDYAAIIDAALHGPSTPAGVVLIGVSEGAGLTVLGLGQGRPCARCKGVIALGLPRKTALGWRWTDFPMWITKRDPKEPMAETRPFLLRLKVPLVMIHSTNDEWDPIGEAKNLFQQAPQPKRFIEVNAINHRFSDKTREVLQHVDQSLAWFASGTDMP